ncbi:MAG: glycosyltransferase family 4 protein, partial [Thermomicrobiales bacterium]
QPRTATSEPVRVGVFIDDFGSTHGVSTFYRALADAPGDGAEITLFHCSDDPSGVALPAIATLPIPGYDGARLAVPSLLDVLQTIERLDLDVVHIAAPGPLGVAAMVAARTLGLPIIGGYHTEFAAYARHFSGDAMVGDIVEIVMRQWFERCDLVIVPSRSTEDSLAARGYRIDRVVVAGNGVDARRFDPARRNAACRERLGGAHRSLLLYSGRISQEKGLEALADAYLALRARRDDVHLVIVGDGPLRGALEDRLGDTATFTGFLSGDALAETIASCDLFVFPSMTDTLGRAVIEAQAAGLPAIVFAGGGPAECILANRTGLLARPGDMISFTTQIERLLDDPERRARMGVAAREMAAAMDWASVRADLVKHFQAIAASPPARRAPLALPSQVAAFSGLGA